jgi:hypothetical protein
VWDERHTWILVIVHDLNDTWLEMFAILWKCANKQDVWILNVILGAKGKHTEELDPEMNELSEYFI